MVKNTNKHNRLGSFCSVMKSGTVVYKRIKLNCTKTADLEYFIYIVSNYLQILNRYTNTPTIRDIKIDLSQDTTLITFSENYCGDSIYKYLRNKDTKNIIKLIEASKKVLFEIPENVYVDAHPLNFTLLSNKLYYVDYIPPITTLNPKLELFEKEFPIFQHYCREQYERRLWRYTAKQGRLAKYNYYLNKILAKTIQ